MIDFDNKYVLIRLIEEYNNQKEEVEHGLDSKRDI